MQFTQALIALVAASLTSAAPMPTPQDDVSVSIVGGSAASEGQFPYTVAMLVSGSQICGGTLVNANTVVTAAHCVTDFTASSMSVRAGSIVSYNRLF